MKQNMKTLLYEIKENKEKTEQKLIEKIGMNVQKACSKIFEETGCTVSKITFPIHNNYAFGKNEPHSITIGIPEIELVELNI